jgi:hypothetical protein
MMRRGLLKSPLVLVVLTCVWEVGCDSPGSSGPQQLTPDTSSDTTLDVADGASPDVQPDSVTPDVQPDSVPPDTSTPSLCELGCIPVATSNAPRGVVFQQYPNGAAPALNGGVSPTGEWVLQRIEVRPNQTFAEGIDVQLANAGQTAGRTSFGGDAMAMAIDLHLAVTVTVLGSRGTDTARQEVAVGGCHEAVGTRLTGSLADCAEGFPAGTTPPSSLDFEHDTANGRLALGLLLSRETLISLLPEDQRQSGELAITGPLYLVARFTRP